MCTNFKDPGLQLYGGELFRALQNSMDTVFINLPPPVPSIPQYNDQLAKLDRYNIPVEIFFGSSIALTKEEKDYINAIRPKIEQLINSIISNAAYYAKYYYGAYIDSELIHIRSHFAMLKEYFNEASFDYGSKHIADCLTIVEKIKSLIKKYRDDEDTKNFLQEIKNEPLDRIFKLTTNT
jgi:hemerythrin